jgi:SAM-dependent methyltransferase
MTSVFGEAYATSYDLLYGDKDYAAECELIVRTIRKYGLQKTQAILDLGCGTGNHALVLAEHGYDVTGVDRSEDMLARARTKAEARGLDTANFQSGDLCSLNLDGVFDAALMMFAVLGYQLENHNVLAALRSARAHLRPNGLLIFDVWYGPAVLHVGPSQRSKTLRTVEGVLVRHAAGTLDISHHLCTVTYQLRHMKDDVLVSVFEEIHKMRYFFPLELDLYLEFAGLRRVAIGAFPEFEREPDVNTWNVLVVARAAE